MPDCLIPGGDMLEARPGFQLIGRDIERAKLCSILVRHHSNSVLLVGPSGVGATSLCLGLQAMKSEDNPPFDIVSKTFFWLDTDKLFAHGNGEAIDTMFRRAFERLARSVEPVLVIEDAGDFLDACQNAGSSHFINMINGAVRKGQMQVILETSDKDASKVLSWHSDLREAYTILDLTEPDDDRLMDIVTEATKGLADFHRVRIDPDAVAAAVELTQKYRNTANGSAQPKRAIEILDQAMASYRLAAHRMPPAAAELAAKIEAGTATDRDRAEHDRLISEHADRQAQLKQLHARQREAETMVARLEEERAQIQQRHAEEDETGESKRISFSSLTRLGGAEQEILEKIDKFRHALDDHRAQYDALANEINATLRLDRNAVVAEFSRISGISASRLGEDQLVILRGLETTLTSKVFGQDAAIARMANAIKVARVGRRNRNRPQASFLLMGPSGVGKTESAKQIAQVLLGDAGALTRFDMSEYMERHAVSKLIGAPPGYEGFEAGGILTNAMRTNRNRVLLFDEIEKAHPDVFHLFLQILDDGRLTDNIGRVAEFSEAIIIMTTNIGQAHFLDTGLSHEDADTRAMEDLSDHYRPEFLNRFNGRQNILPFRRLELPSIERIIRREFDDLAQAYAEHGVTIAFPDTEVAAFCADRYDPVTGARGLPGQVNSELEPRIVNALLERKDTRAAEFQVRYDTTGHRFDIRILAAAA